MTDDHGNTFYFHETDKGLYRSDSTQFRGQIGRKYKLHVKTYSTVPGTYTYESTPVELKAVPPIDSLYYEKVVTGIDEYNHKIECCQIYLDTHDSGQDCKFYRWIYNETWEFHLHWDVPNQVCWRSETSYDINLRNTNLLSENRIKKFPLHFVDNTTDRLSVEYSMLVSQFSMSQDEYNYWEKVKTITQNVGGLYDIVPASIIGNMICNEEPSQPVLGYFSVSARADKRIFIRDNFSGQVNFYAQCVGDTVRSEPIAGLGKYVWILYIHQMNPFYILVTYTQSCADCTTRGTLKKPDYWDHK